MSGEKAEVVPGDAAAVVRMRQRAAAVGDGSAGGHGKKLALHGMELFQLRVPEERGQFRIGQHAYVKGGNESGDHVFTAEAFVKRSVFGFHAAHL